MYMEIFKTWVLLAPYRINVLKNTPDLSRPASYLNLILDIDRQVLLRTKRYD